MPDQSCKKSFDVAVIIPTKNEEINLALCLGRLTQVDEVYVVDSGSNDRTLRIAEKYGVGVVQFRWDGRYPKKREWALRELPLRSRWVLFLDADERVTPEFMREVTAKTASTRFDAYRITYDNYFLGSRLRYGDRMKKLALVRRGYGHFEDTGDTGWTNFDMEVHEHLLVSGPVGELTEPIEHHDFKGLDAYYDRHNRYSSWEAARYATLMGGGRRATHTVRQRIKYALLPTPLLAVAYFVYSYVFRLGFRDGYTGLLFCLGKAFYFLQIAAKLFERGSARRE